jgi:hypothetical protein
MSNSDTLRVIFNLPSDQLYTLKLTPSRFTENSGPPIPAHGRATKIAPGENKGVTVPQMGYFHVHLAPVEGQPDVRPVPFHGRCAVMVEVERGASKSIASIVPLNPPLERGAPWEPNVSAPIMVSPGERRLVHLSDGHALHVHEIPRFFD